MALPEGLLSQAGAGAAAGTGRPVRQPRGAEATAGPAGPALAEPALPVGGPEGRGTDSGTGSSHVTGDPWFDDEPNDQDDGRLPAPPAPPLRSVQ